MGAFPADVQAVTNGESGLAEVDQGYSGEASHHPAFATLMLSKAVRLFGGS
ncbi:MAG TPA: hypothetical protein VHQ45_13205 [Gemmatimonadaceae bacterium]|nr:hypothetical protein [Gemmatimonadaceae bacterium]